MQLQASIPHVRGLCNIDLPFLMGRLDEFLAFLGPTLFRLVVPSQGQVTNQLVGHSQPCLLKYLLVEAVNH